MRSPRLRPANIVHQTMKTSSASASRASNSNHPMSSPRRARLRISLFILGVLCGCASAPLPEPKAEAPKPGPPPVASAALPQDEVAPTTLQRAASRWVPVSYAALPGWNEDRPSQWWPALLRGCERAAGAWIKLCAEARASQPKDEQAIREWLMQHLQPYRVESAGGDATGLMTGYFEPQVDASRLRRGKFRVPLYGPPDDLDVRKPYWTRKQLDTLPTAQAALRGHEIAYVADPLDALLLQVQGSGRLRLIGSDGRTSMVRLAYGGHNDQPYASVGRWLINQGELTATSASWPAIRDWAQRNPKRVQQMLWSNPRVIFFVETPLNDERIGPRGAMGVPLTPGRSVAVDPSSVPYGTPLWLDTTEPLSNTPLQRLVMAQDTGSAIRGAVRADYFWGWGGDAEAQAGRMKQPLRYWALWPRAAAR